MKKRLLLIAAVSLILTSCLSVKSLSPQHLNNKSVILEEGNALVYIIRPALAGFAMPYPLACDSIDLGPIVSKTYFYCSVPAGGHQFVSALGWPGKKRLDLELEEAHTYYILVKSSANLEVIKDEEKAKGYLKKSINKDQMKELKNGIVRFK